jgi:chromosome segregation ATPase
MQDLEDTLNAQHEENLQAELGKINKEHNEELKTVEIELQNANQRECQDKMEELEGKMKTEHEQDKQKLRQEMEKEFSERLVTTQTEMGKVLTKLEETRKQLKELYGKYTKDTKNLARKVEILDHELKKSKSSLEEYQRTIRDLNNEKQTLHSRVDELGKQVDKAEKLRQEVVEMMKKSEKEHEDIITSYKERCTMMNEKIQRLEAQVKMIKAETQQQLLIMQESMEREHNTVIEDLQGKMVDVSRKHTAEIRKLQKQHEQDKEHQLMVKN